MAEKTGGGTVNCGTWRVILHGVVKLLEMDGGLQLFRRAGMGCRLGVSRAEEEVVPGSVSKETVTGGGLLFAQIVGDLHIGMRWGFAMRFV